MTTLEEVLDVGLAIIKATLPTLVGGKTGEEIATGVSVIQQVILTIEDHKSGALTQTEAMTALSQLTAGIAQNNADVDAAAAAKFGKP